jgi:hypothetical protein
LRRPTRRPGSTIGLTRRGSFSSLPDRVGGTVARRPKQELNRGEFMTPIRAEIVGDNLARALGAEVAQFDLSEEDRKRLALRERAS